MYKTRFLLTR